MSLPLWSPANRGFIGSSARPGLPSVVGGVALELVARPVFHAFCGTARPLRRHAPPGAHGSPPAAARRRSHTHNRGGSPDAIAAGDGPPTRPNQPGHFRRGPHDLLLLPPAINSCQPQGHRVARRARLLHTHLRAVREGGAAPASRPSLVFAAAAAACRRPLATLRRRRSRRSTFRGSPRRAPYASPRRSRSRRKMRVSRPCASSWAAPRTRTRRRRGNSRPSLAYELPYAIAPSVNCTSI